MTNLFCTGFLHCLCGCLELEYKHIDPDYLFLLLNLKFMKIFPLRTCLKIFGIGVPASRLNGE